METKVWSRSLLTAGASDQFSLIRSPLAKHRVMLSSSTVFMFSIQMASTGPSITSHLEGVVRGGVEGAVRGKGEGDRIWGETGMCRTDAREAWIIKVLTHLRSGEVSLANNLWGQAEDNSVK